MTSNQSFFRGFLEVNKVVSIVMNYLPDSRWNHLKSSHSCRKLRNGDERRKRQNARGSAARLEFDSFTRILLFVVAVVQHAKLDSCKSNNRHLSFKRGAKKRIAIAPDTHWDELIIPFIRLSHRNRDESKLLMSQPITILSFALQSRLVNRTWARLA